LAQSVARVPPILPAPMMPILSGCAFYGWASLGAAAVPSLARQIVATKVSVCIEIISAS